MVGPHRVSIDRLSIVAICMLLLKGCVGVCSVVLSVCWSVRLIYWHRNDGDVSVCSHIYKKCAGWCYFPMVCSLI